MVEINLAEVVIVTVLIMVVMMIVITKQFIKMLLKAGMKENYHAYDNDGISDCGGEIAGIQAHQCYYDDGCGGVIFVARRGCLRMATRIV